MRQEPFRAKELVLTGYRPFWPEHPESCLFLGPWCFTYHKNISFFDQKNFSFVSSPWNKPKSLEAALNQSNQMENRLIKALTIELNAITSSSYDETFWKALLFGWLSSFVGICYERYKRIEQALDDYKDSKIIIKVLNHPFPGLKNPSDHFNLLENHEYNLFILSDILKKYPFQDHQAVSLKEAAAIFSLNEKPIKKLSLKEKISLLIDKIRYKSAYILEPGFGIKKQKAAFLGFKWGFRLRRWSIRSFPLKIDETKLTLKYFSPENDFESVLKKILPFYFPKSYFEKIVFSGKLPKSIVLPGSSYNFFQQKLVACIKASGGKWYAAQHGGGHNQLSVFPQEHIEYTYTDGFLGWIKHTQHLDDQKKLVTIPSPHLSELLKISQKIGKSDAEEGKIIFCANRHLSYMHRLQDALLPEDQLGFLIEERLFYDYLDREVVKKVFYRPYYTDYGQSSLDYFKQKNIPFLQGKTLLDHLSICKLLILNYLGTSLSEAMIMNRPLLLFWNPKHFGLTRLMADYISAFEKAGIYFKTPEEAAKKCNDICTDPIGWWADSNIQKIRNDFCEDFCAASLDWEQKWKSFHILL